MDPFALKIFKMPPAFGEKYEVTNTEHYSKENVLKALENKFYNLDAIIFANIDAIFNLTHHTGGYLAKNMLGFGSFCNISDKDGWSYYLLYRMPQYYGYMMTKNNINNDYLDMSRLSILYDDFYERIKHIQTHGVNIIITNTNNYNDKMLEILKKNGSIVIEIINNEIINILEKLAINFKKLYIINPITSEKHFIVAYGYGVKNNINNDELINWAKSQLISYTNVSKILYHKILIEFNLPQQTEYLNKYKIMQYYDEVTIGNHWV